MANKPTYEELKKRVREFEQTESKRKQVEEMLRRKTHDLNERNKELICLFAFSNLIEEKDTSLDEIIQGVAELIPPSWQYPEITCSRIILKDKEYKTGNFKETGWRQTNDIFVHGERSGILEVYYLEEKPEIDEGPFLNEERDLISVISERLGRGIERRLAEEALRESEGRYRQLFENSMVGIGLSDRTGRVLAFNDKMMEITGYSKDELPKLDITKTYSDQKDRDELLQFINRDGEIDNFETRLIDKQGKEYWANLSLRLFDYKGEKVILTSLINITRRKLAEEKIVEGEAIVKAIFNSSFDAMALIDTSGIINNINETMASYMSRSVKELTGMFGWSLVSPKISKSRKSIFEKVIQSGETIRFEDERQGMHFDNVFHPVMDTHGRTTKIAIIARDITDRIKAQKIIQKEKKDLEIIVKKRTADLEETNTALNVLLKKRERDKADVEEKVVLNVKVMIEPYLKKLKRSMLNDSQMIYLDILESNVKEIISPFGKKLSSRLISLTPTELKVANLIRQGKTTKQIAVLSNVSPETISCHRKNIRKKLNLTEKKTNLRTSLSSLA